MDRIQQINEKLMIFIIIVGFALGIYLGIGHDNPNLWFEMIPWIFLTTFIATFISTLGGFYAKTGGNEEEISIWSPIRVFILDAAVITVSLSFGFVFCSILIGNFITAN